MQMERTERTRYIHKLSWRNWPLAVKLPLTITSMVVITVAVVSLQSIRREQQSFRTELEQQAVLLLDTIEAAIIDPLYYLDVNVLSDMMEILGQDQEILTSGRIYDAKGRVIADAYGEALSYNIEIDPFGRQLLESDSMVFEWLPNQLIAGRTVDVENHRLGAISVGLPMALLQIKIASARKQGLGTALVATVIGILLALLVNRSITKPLQKLVNVTNRIAQGDLSARLHIATGDEIGDLAISFNNMTEKLQQTTVSKDFVNNIIENMAESLIVTTSAGNIQMVNRETLTLLGYTEHELLHQPVSILFADKQSIRGIDDLIPTGAERSVEKNLLSKTGIPIPVLFSGAKIQNETGVQGVVCAALNIQDRKIAEENLNQAYQALKETQSQLVQTAKLASIGELAAGVAHELNQPLMVIRTTVQFLQRSLRTGNVEVDQLAKHYEPMERNTTRMINIINHLRTFSRQSQTEFSSQDVNKIIEDSFLMMGEQLRLHNIDVKKNLTPGFPSIQGDYNQLEQVFLNLLTNARDAIEATGEKATGQIDIITRVCGENNDFVEILIKDSGTGIAPEHLESIFDPFFTTKEVGKGTGLGLSISYGIIRDHQGDIEVAETGPEGTTFRITLPINQRRTVTNSPTCYRRSTYE